MHCYEIHLHASLEWKYIKFTTALINFFITLLSSAPFNIYYIVYILMQCDSQILIMINYRSFSSEI